MPNWYYAVGKQTAGPVTEDDLRALARRDLLFPSTYVVPDGESTWRQLGEVEDRLALTRTGPDGYGPPRPAPAAAPEDDASPAPAPGPSATPTPTPTPTVTTATAPPTVGTGAVWAPPAGFPAPGRAPSQVLGFASWGRRLGAKAIDLAVLLVPQMVITVLVAWQDVLDRLEAGAGNPFALAITGPMIVAAVLAGVVNYAYFAVLNGRGQTLGKLALGIRVVGLADGQPIGWRRGLLRHGIQFLQVIPVGWAPYVLVFVLIDSLVPLRDPNCQAIHDRLAGSAVVRIR